MAAMRTHLARFAALFVFALIAASCGGSSADPVDAASPAADAVTESTTLAPPTTEAPDDTMDDGMEDGHETDDTDGAEDHEGDDTEGHEDEFHDDEGHDDEGQEDDGHSDEGEMVEVPEDARVEFVFMNEYGYEPEVFTAKPGETVVYRIMNTGFFPHEFRLSNAHRVEEHIESGHEGHGEEGGHHGDHGDIVLELEPGRSGELVVTYPMDETLYTLVVCLLPDHYEQGMHTTLTYE